MNAIKYYSSRDVCSYLGISRKTLLRWSHSGKIKFIRTSGGWRKYDLDGYLNLEKPNRLKVIYCRVSSYDRRDDMNTQVNFLRNLYPHHKVITDIGSGINFKKKGILEIIDLAINNKLDELVVAYKDRLCRIGYPLVEHILTKYSNTKIIIVNYEDKPPAQEIVDDLIEIITVYSSKIYGSRSYKK